MKFLYDDFDNPFARVALDKIEVPDFISDNLRHEIRPYQEEAFKRFIYISQENSAITVRHPFHLLYNMATGSGKTLIMAGLMFYLFKQGYRNFIFFVSSDNIIRKTKDNFLDTQSSKYLFRDEITIDGKKIYIKETENFQYTDPENITIKFTTIQKLHSDLNNARENNITYDDFRERRMVLLADEAHHLNSGTKGQADLFNNWERTVLKIHGQNPGNVLLEFTATVDYDEPEILKKYSDKVIFRYGLAEFRKDKYSKEISLIRSLYDQDQRILQALILNLYRQELANANGIDLKPVILFKAKKTISESEKNLTDFHLLIESLSEKHIDELRSTSAIESVQNAFAFFDRNKKSSSQIARSLKSLFKPANCISANNDKEIDETRSRLNTLEEANNPVRAVFAVHKLNEGWDVLNLFDIVRLYEGQNSGGSNKKPGATTLSEAQLIGRGARYFPFRTEEGQELYKRKFDNDFRNELKVLEELFYHAKDENRYISELKKVLIETGIYRDEERLVTRTLKLKDGFKASDFFMNGKVIFNKRIEKHYDKVSSFSDFGVSKVNFNYALSSGNGSTSALFTRDEDLLLMEMKQKDVKLSEIPAHITRYALSQNPFYRFDNLTLKLKCFPNLKSLTEFIESPDYLGGISVTFRGTAERLEQLTNKDFMFVLQYLLKEIEVEIRDGYTAYEGSEYMEDYVRNVFTDKEIRVDKDSERADGQEEVVGGESWYAYNANYGTSEEKAFVQMFARRFDSLDHRFDDIRLMRNERFVEIVNTSGRAFEPDFILFCREKRSSGFYYQVYIEPKGKHLIENDRWKQDFLKKIRDENRTLIINSDKYLVTGVPVFYSKEEENEFIKVFEDVLSV